MIAEGIFVGREAYPPPLGGDYRMAWDPTLMVTYLQALSLDNCVVAGAFRTAFERRKIGSPKIGSENIRSLS